jgi:hypothetical protein
MKIPEEPPRTEEPASSREKPFAQAASPKETFLPEGFTPLDEASRHARARRRRAHHMLISPSADERGTLLEGLARRALPSIEFFLFAIFTGAILGIAFLFDSPALLLLGLLFAPLLTPWVGLTLSILTGSWRFFFLTLGGMLIASLLVFLTGALAGVAGRLWLPLSLIQAGIHSKLWWADFHSHLWWPDLFVVALGAIWLTISFVHSEEKPVAPSIILAYGLFLPLSAGSVGLGLGASPIWPNGVLVFLVHLTLTILVGGITLAALRFKPVKASGYLLPTMLGVLSLIVLVTLTGLTQVIRNGILDTRRSAPTPIATTLALPSMTPILVQTPTRTPTPAATLILVDSSTPTATPIQVDSLTPLATPKPTPSFAVINVSSPWNGANVRTEPAGSLITVLANGSLVQLLPETQTVNSEIWAHIRMDDDAEGWVLQAVLGATTRTFSPTSTLAPTLTP